MSADDDLLKQTTPGTPSPAVERPRNTGSQRALVPDGPVPAAPRASNPAMPAVRTSSPAIPAAPRASNPGIPAARTSSPGMPAAQRRASNPAMPRVGTGSNAAHRPAPAADAGAGPTEAGVGKGEDPTAPGLKPGVRVSGLHKATVPKKKKGGAGKTAAFAVAVALLFGVGVVWVVLHPEVFPGANDAATSVAPKRLVKPPLLKAPPREPHDIEVAPTEVAKPADDAKPADVKPADAKPADDKPDEIAKPEPGNTKPGPHHRPKVTKVEPARPVAAAEPEAPKEEKPPPTTQQLTDKQAAVETLLANKESVQGPDPVVRGFLTQVKAEVAAADSDDKKRQAWAHLNQLQARLAH